MFTVVIIVDVIIITKTWKKYINLKTHCATRFLQVLVENTSSSINFGIWSSKR